MEENTENERIREIVEERNPRIKAKKIRALLKKQESLRKVILTPEQEVSKAKILNSKNLYKLLSFLRNIYPIGYSFNGLKEQMKLIIFSEIQLDVLSAEGLIVKRDLGFSEDAKKYINPNFLKHYPEYAITIKGMEFLNSIEVRDLSKKIEVLTRILLGFGAITIVLMILSIIINT